jgi:hypothetical protein
MVVLSTCLHKLRRLIHFQALWATPCSSILVFCRLRTPLSTWQSAGWLYGRTSLATTSACAVCSRVSAARGRRGVTAWHRVIA